MTAEIDWGILGPALGEIVAITIGGIWMFRRTYRQEKEIRQDARRITRPLWRQSKRRTPPLI